MSNLKDTIKGMSETEKIYKNSDETLEIIKKVLDYNKGAQKIFQHASKFDKGKSKSKPKESIALQRRQNLKREGLLKLKKKKKKT